jgi:hypothetical protein
MTRVLGYDRYLAQGGDWGSAVSAWIGYDHGTDKGGACVAVHLNMVGTRGADMIAGTEEERAWEAARAKLHRREGAYFELRSTKPQSLAYAMMDSPWAWRPGSSFAAWSDLPRTASGEPAVLARYTRDQLLTEVMIYLVTSMNTRPIGPRVSRGAGYCLTEAGRARVADLVDQSWVPVDPSRYSEALNPEGRDRDQQKNLYRTEREQESDEAPGLGGLR